MCWSTNATGRLLLWYFQTEGKPKILEIPWECRFPAYFYRLICLSFISFKMETQEGQEIAELKHTLSVIGSHSFKVLSRTAWREVIVFPEGFPYFESWLQFYFFFLWKQMISTLSVKKEDSSPCGSAWWTMEVEPAGRKSRGILSEFDLLPVRILLKWNKLCDSSCSEWTCKFCRKHIIMEFLASFWGSDTSKKIRISYSWGFQVTLKGTSRSGSAT